MEKDDAMRIKSNNIQKQRQIHVAIVDTPPWLAALADK